MDAGPLLESVAKAYSNLKSLEVQATSITESHDDGFSHTEHPVTFFYVAPDKVRLQQGNRGTTTVSDGQDLHTHFHSANRYAKIPVSLDHLAGMLNPRF